MRYLITALLALTLFGCGLSEKAQQNIEVEGSAHDRYASLIQASLSGDVSNPEDHVSQADLDATPTSVARLLQRAIIAVYLSRGSWHSIAFDVDLGPDPATLTLEPPELFQNGSSVKVAISQDQGQ